MKTVIGGAFIAVLLCSAAYSQEYIPTDQNSSVSFKIKNHLIGTSTVTGHFTGLTGKIVFEPQKIGSSSFDVSVNINSIKTGIGKRDNDLKKDKFFNAEKYPTAHFKSTKVTGSGGKYIAYGELTIKGTSKSVEIPFTATQEKGGYLFKGAFNVNRMNFGVSGDQKSIDDQAAVSLQVFARKK
ncbi:MAG: YceI family protein [Flavipsychrobacter sp.]